jgi:hypothetical protein
VLGKHRGNASSIDQNFCVALTAKAPFPLTVGATNPISGKVSYTKVDYNNLPIRCRQCLSIFHLIKECPTITSKEVESKPESGGNRHATRQTRDGGGQKEGSQGQKTPTTTNQPIGKGDHTKIAE